MPSSRRTRKKKGGRSVSDEKSGAKSRVFNVLVERDEDGWLVGSVVELPGCHTQAKTLGQLRKRIREAIELYLEHEGFPKGAKSPRFVGMQQVEVSA